MDPAWKAAALAGDTGRMRALRDLGHHIDQLDRYGQTALMLCARQGRLDSVAWLIEQGADLDHAAKYGLTAAMLAAVNGHDDIVILLADGGADMTLTGSGAPGFAGRTAGDLQRVRDEAARTRGRD